MRAILDGSRAVSYPSGLDARPSSPSSTCISAAALVGLILMHSGRDAGLGGMGFTPASQGGTHIVERNLTRLTVVVAVLFFANTIVLFRLLE